jgi:hypothetical protein
MPVQGIGRLAGMQADEPAEDIACELLDGLNSLPVECVSRTRLRCCSIGSGSASSTGGNADNAHEQVATNGPSLVQKVRFVAIQLMECSVSPSPTTARAYVILCSSHIERSSGVATVRGRDWRRRLTMQSKAAHAILVGIERHRGNVHVWQGYLCRLRERGTGKWQVRSGQVGIGAFSAVQSRQSFAWLISTNGETTRVAAVLICTIYCMLGEEVCRVDAGRASITCNQARRA